MANIVDNAIWIGIESIVCALAIGPTAGVIAGVTATTYSCIQGAGVSAIDNYKDYTDNSHEYNHSSLFSVCYTGRGEFCTDAGVCLTGATICDNDSNNDSSGKDCVIS